MNKMDNQLDFLCHSNQMRHEDVLFPYRVTGYMMQNMHQGIPVIRENLKIHKKRAEEMRQERMRYQRILDEAVMQLGMGLVVRGLSFALSEFKRWMSQGCNQVKIPSTGLGLFSLGRRNRMFIFDWGLVAV
ncbi:hypothetical protein PIB30_036340 [Stylosanthes scabra]|uniref:Uncharacterized protein n=1 Tax=Stylosanthes scabra TaxID=79078 RepID=A0ABU6VD17_9FABA|nr:hypothetical protein [Stylosanthes scabra]